jgi:hypothetical protein
MFPKFDPRHPETVLKFNNKYILFSNSGKRERTFSREFVFSGGIELAMLY